MSYSNTEGKDKPLTADGILAVFQMAKILLPGYKSESNLFETINQIILDDPLSWNKEVARFIIDKGALGHEEAQLHVITELAKEFFPTGYNSGVENDIKGIFHGTGFGEWAAALYDYFMQYGKINKPGAEQKFVMSFQEVTELVSLLPSRGPKELELHVSRDHDGRLELQFVGKIDVARTAGRKEEEK